MPQRLTISAARCTPCVLFSLAASCLLTLLLSAVCWAQPVGLARYVPSDAGLFVEIDDLPAGLQRYAEGPLHKRLLDYPAWSEWTQSESQGIHDVSQSLSAAFGLNWETFTKDIVSGRIAFATWPANETPSGEPNAGNGATLLILETRNADSLNKVASGFRQLQETAGLSWKEDTVNGIRLYVGAAKAGSPRSGYTLAIIGKTAIVSDSTDLCRRVLKLFEVKTAEPPPTSLAALKTYAECIGTLPADADGYLFLNPAPWRSVLASRLAASTDSSPEQIKQQATIRLWESLRYGAASIRLDREVELAAVFQFDEALLPNDMKALLYGAAGESQMLAAIPADCLAAVAIHFNLARLPGWLFGGSGPASPILNQISTALGPEFGAHLTVVGNPPWLEDRVLPDGEKGNNAKGDAIIGDVATDDAVKSVARRDQLADRVGDDQASDAPFPLAWVFEMRIRPPLGADMPKDLDSMLRDAMPEVINLAYRVTKSSLFSNLHTLVDQGTQLSSLQEWTLFSAGESTSFAYKDGYVLASASPQAVNEFRGQTEVQGLADDPKIWPMLNRPVLGGAPNQVLYLNCRGLRELLSERSAQIASAIESAQGVSRDKAKLAVSQMIDVLRLADHVSTSARVTKDRVAISSLITADDE